MTQTKGVENNTIPQVPGDPIRKDADSVNDPLSFLKRERQAIRQEFAVRGLTSADWEAKRDGHWAETDPQVQAEYQGEFVVPVGRRIVAHGPIAVEVLAEAAKRTGKAVEELPLVGVASPLLEHRPDGETL